MRVLDIVLSGQSLMLKKMVVLYVIVIDVNFCSVSFSVIRSSFGMSISVIRSL